MKSEYTISVPENTCDFMQTVSRHALLNPHTAAHQLSERWVQIFFFDNHEVAQAARLAFELNQRPIFSPSVAVMHIMPHSVFPEAQYGDSTTVAMLDSEVRWILESFSGYSVYDNAFEEYITESVKNNPESLFS